jgi:hypothetical protein
MRTEVTIDGTPVTDEQRHLILAILAFLGLLSFAALMPLPREAPDPPDDQGRPFIFGVSAFGGPDCFGGCLPNPLDRRALETIAQRFGKAK